MCVLARWKDLTSSCLTAFHKGPYDVPLRLNHKSFRSMHANHVCLRGWLIQESNNHHPVNAPTCNALSSVSFVHIPWRKMNVPIVSKSKDGDRPFLRLAFDRRIERRTSRSDGRNDSIRVRRSLPSRDGIPIPRMRWNTLQIDALVRSLVSVHRIRFESGYVQGSGKSFVFLRKQGRRRRGEKGTEANRFGSHRDAYEHGCFDPPISSLSPDPSTYTVS